MASLSAARVPVLLAAALVLTVSFLAGCASTRIEAQWTDPEFAKQSFLQGSKVLVVCSARDTAVERICEEQLSQQLAAAGATPVPGPGGAGAASGQLGEATLAAAREAGAKAILSAGIARDATVVSPGPSVGIGIGGFGTGRRIGGGVGVSVPVGGEQVNTAYAADMTLTDVASGRVIWTSTATAPASRDVNAQVASLAKTGIDAAKTAGLF